MVSLGELFINSKAFYIAVAMPYLSEELFVGEYHY